MAQRRSPSRDPRRARASVQCDTGNTVAAVRQPPIRRSARLAGTVRPLCKREGLYSSETYAPKATDATSPSQTSPGQKRKREAEVIAKEPLVKRARREIQTPRCRSPPRDLHEQEESTGIRVSKRSHISQWAESSTWPKEFFKESKMQSLLARRKSTPSLRRKLSESSFTSATPSDQKPREEKSAPYRNPAYETLLEAQGASYMYESELGTTSGSLCRYLLETKVTTPKGTLFSDDVFDKCCQKLQGKNEARIIQDISRLLVPSVETLASLGSKHLNVAVESVNEGWNSSIPVTKPRPQPDYAVGFGRSAFSERQLSKLEPFLGDPLCQSYFKTTYYMLFSFLACEVKCGVAGLDITDRQNAHSMTLAVRALVELFRIVKREKELHRNILAFSVSHDHDSVRIFGYYPVIEDRKTKVYRHSIRKFFFTELEGKEKWTTYTFIKNIYDTWMPNHLKNIASAIDAVPDELDLGLPEGFEAETSQRNPTFAAGETHGRQRDSNVQALTPETSTPPKKRAFKKPKGKH